MNTKNILFTSLFILFTFTAATVVYKQKSSLPVTAATSAQGFSQINPVPGELPDHSDDTRHPDDDGKYHDYHFDRILHFRRGRLVCMFCAKTVIAIIHLALLLLAYLTTGH